MTGIETRAMQGRRIDARRNRDAIMRAAKSLLSQSGSVAMKDIARQAEVGQGTLYRHFQDRSAVAAAIFDEQLDLIDERLSTGAPDDPRRLRHVLDGLAETFVLFHGLGEVVRESSRSEEGRELHRRFVDLVEAPLAEARAAGLVRSDATVGDIVLLCCMLDGALRNVDESADRAAVARRVIDLVLEGLRTEVG